MRRSQTLEPVLSQGSDGSDNSARRVMPHVLLIQQGRPGVDAGSDIADSRQFWPMTWTTSWRSRFLPGGRTGSDRAGTPFPDVERPVKWTFNQRDGRRLERQPVVVEFVPGSEDAEEYAPKFRPGSAFELA